MIIYKLYIIVKKNWIEKLDNFVTVIMQLPWTNNCFNDVYCTRWLSYLIKDIVHSSPIKPKFTCFANLACAWLIFHNKKLGTTTTDFHVWQSQVMLFHPRTSVPKVPISLKLKWKKHSFEFYIEYACEDGKANYHMTFAMTHFFKVKFIYYSYLCN